MGKKNTEPGDRPHVPKINSKWYSRHIRGFRWVVRNIEYPAAGLPLVVFHAEIPDPAMIRVSVDRFYGRPWNMTKIKGNHGNQRTRSRRRRRSRYTRRNRN